MDIENLLRKRWTGVALASAVIISFGLPWAYLEDQATPIPPSWSGWKPAPR